MIESGEETGCLPEVVNELHKFMGESKELKDFIVSSSVYPLSILVIVLGVTVLLFTVFVPKFAKIFYDMGRELPGAMSALVAFGDFAKWAWWMIPLGLYLAYIACKHIYGETEMKRKISGFIIKLPLLGGILVDLEMCKYLPEDAPQKKIYESAASQMLEAVIDKCTGDMGVDYDGLVYHVTAALPQGKGIDECAAYGDYFYLEALMRYQNPDWNRYW